MLLGLCLALLLSWIVVSHWEMQQALRWWFRKEVIDRTVLSNQIQNELIQDLFALRLCLRSSLSEQSEVFCRPKDWLADVEKIQQGLYEMSASLSFPYLDESLPLAIRSLLKQWQITHPQHNVKFDLPQHNWQQDAIERNQMILTTLGTLLTIVIPSSLSSASLNVNLFERSNKAELIVKITYPDRLTFTSATHAKELRYLRYCFRCLTPGLCFYHHHALEAIWRFQWKHSCSVIPL